MFSRMWISGKLTGKLSCRYSGCQRKLNKSRQDTVPQAPSLSHVIKTVMLSLLLPEISSEIKFLLYWLFHTSTLWFYFSKRLHQIDHDSGLSLTTCFPPLPFMPVTFMFPWLFGIQGLLRMSLESFILMEQMSSVIPHIWTSSLITRLFYISTLCPIFLVFVFFFYRMLFYHSSAFSSCWCSRMGKNLISFSFGGDIFWFSPFLYIPISL